MCVKQFNTIFFVIKPIRCTNFTNLFCHETLHVSDSSSVHQQESIHCTLSNGICHTGTAHTAFEQDQVVTAVPSWSCSKAVYKLVLYIPLLSVQ
jgi:UDP-N-acetylglucosamine 2-epimerase